MMISINDYDHKSHKNFRMIIGLFIKVIDWITITVLVLRIIDDEELLINTQQPISITITDYDNPIVGTGWTKGKEFKLSGQEFYV